MTVKLSSLRVSAEMDATAYTKGMADKVAADQRGVASARTMGAALAQLDAASERSGDAVAALSRKWIDGYANAARFEKAVRDIGRAVDTGMAMDRASAALDGVYRRFGLTADAAVLAKQGFVSLVPTIEDLNKRYASQTPMLEQQAVAYTGLGRAVGAVGSTSKLASHEVTNLTAQLQDITVSLAGGQSPFTVMLQQGSQISALMGDRGLKTIIGGVGSALLSLINPTTAVLAGFTALYVGGTYAYDALVGSSKSLEEQLKEHDRLIKLVTGSYEEATGAATRWEGASRAVTTVKATQALADMQKQLEKLTASFMHSAANFTLLPNDPIGRDVFAGARAEFSAFATEIARFQASAKDPAAWRVLENGVATVALANPTLTETGAKLLGMMEGGLKAAAGVGQLDSALRTLSGTADATDLSRIGIDKLQKDAEHAAKVIARLKEDLSVVGDDRAKAIDKAMRDLGHGASLDQRSEVYLLAGQKYDREQAAKEAEKRAREAQSDAKRASDELARDAGRVWDDTRTAAEKYAEEMAKLNDLLAKGAISQDTFARASSKAADALRGSQMEEYRKSLERSNDALAGVTLATLDYQKRVGSLAKQTAEYTTSMFSSMENAFVDFVKTGKVNFSDLVDSMIADLARLAFQQSAMGLMGMLGFGGTAGGGSMSYVTGGAGPMAVPTFGFHSGGIVGLNPTFVRDVPPTAFLDAPRFHAGGGFFGPRERPAILELGEEVLRRDDPRHAFNGGRRAAIGDSITASLEPVFNIDARGSNMTDGQVQQIALATVQEWWRYAKRDVINVIREARLSRTRGV